jgi:hypothetical protein
LVLFGLFGLFGLGLALVLASSVQTPFSAAAV